jgi:hypothetical protein
VTNKEIERIKLSAIRAGNLAILEVYVPYQPTLSMIHTAVKMVLGYEPVNNRAPNNAIFRFYVFYFANEYTNLFNTEIGLYYNKHKGVVLYGTRVIKDNYNNPTMSEIPIVIAKVKKKLKLY